MDPTTSIWVAMASGVIVVIGGILWLRLHACLALLLGALVVGLLTPQSTRERYQLDDSSIPLADIDESGRTATVLRRHLGGLETGSVLVVLRRAEGERVPTDVGRATLVDIPSDKEAPFVIAWNVGTSDDDRPDSDDSGGFQAGDGVLTFESFKSARDRSNHSIGKRLATGFGATAASIGILIAMASVIGRCLMDSGAADRIVRGMLKSCGEKRAPLAFLGSGFLLGIPVFFDTVFYLMIPLAKALHVRTRKDYLLYVLSIVAGATMAHSLVPPTPGPLYVAEEFKINLVTMTVGGCIVGMAAAMAGYLFAVVMNHRVGLEIRDAGSVNDKTFDEVIEKDESRLPPFLLAILPLLLPTVLIAMGTMPWKRWEVPPAVIQIVGILSDKNIALGCAAVISIGMLWKYGNSDSKSRQKAIEAAVADGGSIVLITSAGGAFGAMLQQTGVTTLINDLPPASPAAMCALAFVVTTAIRTAQGSATVAMITAVSIFSGLATGGLLGFHPVYLGLAIGCGSKPFAWMNDSGFWVITRMSGMTEQEGLKFVTPMSLIMGVVGLGMVLLGVTLLPNF